MQWNKGIHENKQMLWLDMKFEIFSNFVRVMINENLA